LEVHQSKRLILALAALAALSCGPSIPEVPFAAAGRDTIVSTVRTNGRVAPLRWTAIRAGSEGAVTRILVERGQTVARGAVLLELESGSARADLAAATARKSQAEADLAMLEQGGRASELARIRSGIASAEFELETARTEAAGLERLVEKQAATRHELSQARERARKAEVQISSLKAQEAAIVSPVDRREAESRIRNAEAAIAAARRRIDLSTVRAPMAGVLYQLDIRPGAYVRPGDLIGEVGEIDAVRVTIFVDEPELGRVDAGMPVSITWDALPQREWSGRIDKVPAQIVSMGTRQVGEVTGVIENADHTLPPGANVNAVIESKVVENVVAIPKEALRRRGEEVGVFVLNGETVSWRTIEVGSSSITLAEAVTGVSAGDQVALATEVDLADGQAVTPVIR